MLPVRVIVVGAGVSGIAAASRLLENGFTDITVLEAGSRIGGRICTEQFGHGIIEMGAQWVHGEKGNVVFDMANPRGLLTESITALFDDTTVYVDSSGNMFKIYDKAHIFDIIKCIDDDSKIYFKKNTGSVGDYFTSEFNKRLKEKNIPTNEWPLAKSILDWYEKLENSIDASDSWFETSGNGLTQYWDCEGNLLWSWKSGGFKTILDILMKKDEKEIQLQKKIIFNKEVENIVWDNLQADKKGKIEVKCTDNSLFIGDHVVVTVSLGVLKKKADSLFSPPLPKEKLTSIKGLSIGIVDKIFLKFPYRWWPTDVQGFNVLWTEDDKKNIKTHNSSWLQGIFGIWALDNQPLILYTWAVGPWAKLMEALTDDEVKEDLMELLKKYLGKHFTIPEPDEIRRSSWGSDSHFCGSYSFRSLNSDKLSASADKLGKPVCNSDGKEVLLFAGEATHDHYYSTVHGAIETGWREAERIIKQYRNPKSFKVVIIGAGISGLAAAKTLLTGGIYDLKILEAQQQPGGRICSLRHENGWLESGAQWIHGQNSEVWRLANQYGLLSETISSEGEGLYLREDGTEIEPRIVHEVYNVVSEILQECEHLAKSYENDIPLSIGHYLKQRFIEYLKSCHNDSDDVKNMKYELYDWHVRFQVIDNSCTVLDKLSAKAWGNYIFCGGTDYVNLKEGYSSLVNCIVNSLPSGAIKLCCPVKRIIWKTQSEIEQNNSSNFVEYVPFQENTTYASESIVRSHNKGSSALICPGDSNEDEIIAPVRIECEDGSVIFAEHVIVTCSLGHLKENYKTMFNPQLPDLMCKAIEDLGFATINKIYLSYDEPWWSEDTKGFQLIWFRNNEKNDYSQPSSWTRDLTGFDVLYNYETVLLGWVGGKGAEHVEELTELEIADHCTDLLQKFTRRTDIPKPKQVIRTQWHANPFIRGAYSHTSTTCDESKVGPSTLAEPVYIKVKRKTKSSSLRTVNTPVILFAGEATHETFFSTTHGAYESGKRQAEVILSFQKSIMELQQES